MLFVAVLGGLAVGLMGGIPIGFVGAVLLIIPKSDFPPV